MSARLNLLGRIERRNENAQEIRPIARGIGNLLIDGATTLAAEVSRPGLRGPKAPRRAGDEAERSRRKIRPQNGRSTAQPTTDRAVAVPGIEDLADLESDRATQAAAVERDRVSHGSRGQDVLRIGRLAADFAGVDAIGLRRTVAQRLDRPAREAAEGRGVSIGTRPAVWQVERLIIRRER